MGASHKQKLANGKKILIAAFSAFGGWQCFSQIILMRFLWDLGAHIPQNTYCSTFGRSEAIRLRLVETDTSLSIGGLS